MEREVAKLESQVEKTEKSDDYQKAQEKVKSVNNNTRRPTNEEIRRELGWYLK